MLKDVIKESFFEEKIISEAFSDRNLEKVAKLLASLASKKLGDGKYFPLLGKWYKDEFIVEGRKGFGFRFMSEKGNMIRFGFLNLKTKAKTLKNKFSINRVDYWIPDGNSKFDKPSVTIEIEPWFNIVESVNEIFNALKGKNEDFNEDLSKLKVPKKLISYALYKGLSEDEIEELGTWTKIKRKLEDLGLWDDDEYRGFKVKKGKKEIDNVKKDLDEVEEKVKKVKVDPNVIFDDIEKLTELIAKNILKQNGFVIVGSPGLGKCKPGYEMVNIKGI